jgi:hypothetical protein
MPRVRSAVHAVAVLLLLAAASGCSEKKGLRITGIEPVNGIHTGNTLVTIRGGGFQQEGAKGVKVLFGAQEARVLGFVGDDVLKVETPPGEVGKTVDILVVFDDSRSLSYEKAFTYTEDTSQHFNVDTLTEGETGKPPESASAAPAPTK